MIVFDKIVIEMNFNFFVFCYFCFYKYKNSVLMYGIGIINFELVFLLLVNILVRVLMKLFIMGCWIVIIFLK